MNSKNLLFLTTQLPAPAISGGVIKTAKLVEHLSQEYNLFLGCLLKDEDNFNVVNYQKTVRIAGFFSEELTINRSPLSFLKSVIANKTLNEFRNFSAFFSVKVEEVSQQCDLIFIDHFEMFQYVPSTFKGKVVFHEHNAEWVLWKRFAEIATNPIKKAVLNFESNRIKKKEIEAITVSNLTFASPNDRAVFLKCGIKNSAIEETYHLGNDNMLDLPELEFDKLPDNLVFVGTLSWEANVDGLIYFMEEILPKVIEVKPMLKFIIAGKNPPDRLIEISKRFSSTIEFTGFLEHLEEVFTLGKVFVLPLRFGSGMKVKFLDALYRGMPVVSSTIGSEGIDVVNHKHAEITDNSSEFAQSILDLLASKLAWEEMSRAQKKLAKQKYTWQAHLKSISEGLNSIQ